MYSDDIPYSMMCIIQRDSDAKFFLDGVFEVNDDNLAKGHTTFFKVKPKLAKRDFFKSSF